MSHKGKKSYVYVLYSREYNRFYVGMTSDLKSRLEDHNSGRVKSSKPYRNWIIVHYEEYDTIKEARRREKYLKTAAGRKWRKENIDLSSIR